MSSLSAAIVLPEEVSEIETPTASSVISAPPPSQVHATPEANERREERAKRRWRCKTRECMYRQKTLTPKNVRRVRGAVHCPNCEQPTLYRVDSVQPSGSNVWYCNATSCDRHHLNQPIIQEDLDKQGGALVCPECGDSITKAQDNGAPLRSQRETLDRTKKEMSL